MRAAANCKRALILLLSLTAFDGGVLMVRVAPGALLMSESCVGVVNVLAGREKVSMIQKGVLDGDESMMIYSLRDAD